MTIGNRLKDRLEELNLKQNELARRLGVSPTTLNGYFTDYREPDIKTLEKLAIELQTTVEYLVTGESPAPLNAKSPVYDDEALELMEEMHKRPELKVLFSTSRKATKQDIEAVDKLLKHMAGEDDDEEEQGYYDD